MYEVICRHEAAHAVCGWYFGFDIAQVHVLSDFDLRRRKWLSDRFSKQLINVRGHTEYKTKLFTGIDRVAGNGSCKIKSYARIRLAVIMAGPIMTALDCGQSISFAFLFGGDDDKENAYKVRAFAGINQKEMFKIIESTALFLLSPPASKAISEVGVRLENFGKLNGPQIDMLCRQAFKVRPGVDPQSRSGLSRKIDPRRMLAEQLTRGSIAV